LKFYIVALTQLAGHLAVFFDFRFVKHFCVRGSHHADRIAFLLGLSRMRTGIGRGIIDILFEDVSYGLTMLFVILNELLTFLKIESSREICQFPFIGRHTMFLVIMHQLQCVFNFPEKDITAGQVPIFVGLNQTMVNQPDQSIKRVDTANGGMSGTIGHLQILGGKFHITDGAFSRFDFSPVFTFLFQFRFNALLHFQDVFAHFFRLAVENLWFNPSKEINSQILIPRNHTRFEHGLLFPQATMPGEIINIGIYRGDQCSRSPPGTQTHVNAI